MQTTAQTFLDKVRRVVLASLVKYFSSNTFRTLFLILYRVLHLNSARHTPTACLCHYMPIHISIFVSVMRIPVQKVVWVSLFSLPPTQSVLSDCITYKINNTQK